MIFAMVSTGRSASYTAPALSSFFKSTPLAEVDEVLLIVNDPVGMPDLDGIGADRARLTVLEHEAPRSFAANVNLALERADARGCGLVFLNNDLVFTPGWLAPVVASDDAIVLPTCNQQSSYERDGLHLRYFMTLEDFGGRQAQLDAVAADHAAAHSALPWRRDLLMPFFCVHIPHRVLSAVGGFDEAFGAGGGEDVDYRIRAMLTGFDVRYASQSYVLHFMGQSTWRSGEEAAETAARDARYRHRFTEKWGTKLASLLLPNRDAAQVATELGVADDIARGDYLTAIRACLPTTSPEAAQVSDVPQRPAICLNMIVKNEIVNIERCLASIADHISCWVICDTGSTDGTPESIQAFFEERKIPGELHSFPFQDFSQARNRALDLARASTLAFDHILFTDADMELAVEDPASLHDLAGPAYHLLQTAGIVYWNLRLLRRDVPAVYKGVTHEYLDLKGATFDHLKGARFIDHASGANRVGKFERDAKLLWTALADEGDPMLAARYTFYLANTLRDAGDAAGALSLYLRRAGLGYWDQEVYVSLLNTARLKENLEYPDDEVIAAYLDAAEACPTRAEALHGAARFCRSHNRHARGYAFAQQGLKVPAPENALFSEQWIYDVGLLDEFAINAYWAGHYAESAQACRDLLKNSSLLFNDKERIVKNLSFAQTKLAEEARAASPNAASSAVPTSARHWQPDRPLAGTELMVESLRKQLGSAIEAIDLRINLYDPATRDSRPLVLWVHHDIDQAAVQWCRDPAMTDPVARFVFISYWQRERYVAAFGLRPERCVVIKHAMEPASEPRIWEPAPVFRCAYTSTPFRGLDLLLDVWERLPAGRAELHVWSSMKLYTMDDAPYRHLIERARSMSGVVYHGLAPNAELRAALRTMHFLTYPNTFAETACLSVMEAMSAGCRVIVPAHGVLPETTGGYARVYPWNPDKATHAAVFAEELEQEFANPWDGRPEDALAQQAHCATIFAWERRLGEWRRLVSALHDRAAPPPPTAARPATAAAISDATTPRPVAQRTHAVRDVTRHQDHGSTGSSLPVPPLPIRPSFIPTRHPGVDYKAFSAELSKKRGSKAYMEIGVQNGMHLSTISAERAIGIDPQFIISSNISAQKKNVELYQGTSDEFFASGKPTWMEKLKLDLIFLDGMHAFEFLLRDFYHAEKVAGKNALLMMHDCLPLNAEMTERNEKRSYEIGRRSKFPGYWTGDVWKIIPILKKYRTDLKIVCVDCPPTGLVCVTGLDNTSNILEEHYLIIVEEFMRVPNDTEAISNLYRDLEIVSSESILQDHDHSLYFRL